MNPQPVISEVQEAVQRYLDGIHEGNTSYLKRVMHPDCRMVSASEQGYLNIGMTEYFDLVASRKSPRDIGEPRVDEVLGISQVDQEVATVRLRCLVLGKLCEDALTLILHEGSWRIISKVFVYSLVERDTDH